MLRLRLAGRVLLAALALAGVVAASSCNGASGIGVGVEAPTRWGGGGSSGPPIFAGGPSF
jgi:hypothetical protein